ncbi:MAG: discoidin domain-containing protein [Coprococcus phoceensis]
MVDKEAGFGKTFSGNSNFDSKIVKDKEVTFKEKVADSAVIEIPREEFDGITSSANTEQSSGEPAGSGVASAATDGDSSTYWHSQWSGFTVSKENPAILTVDLGKEMSIGGFKFQQRPGTNNGIVYKYPMKL